MACNISSYLCTLFCAVYHIMTPKHHTHAPCLLLFLLLYAPLCLVQTPLFSASQDTHATHHLGTHANLFVSDRSRK